MSEPILNLADQWRERANDPFVPEDIASVVSTCADELEAVIRSTRVELLTQTQAAKAIAVNPSTIRRWEREGRLRRAKPHGKPLYRRCDVEAAARGEPVSERVLQMIEGRGG